MGLATKWFRNESFRNAGPNGVKCFWCGCQLFKKGPKRIKATVEHVIPSSFGGADCQTNFELACIGCQDSRGRISTMRANLIDLLKMRRHPEQRCTFEQLLERWRQKRQKNLALFLHWQSVYNRLLTGGRLQKCMAELDEVLEFP
jgi:hypothetical protein